MIIVDSDRSNYNSSKERTKTPHTTKNTTSANTNSMQPLTRTVGITNKTPATALAAAAAATTTAAAAAAAVAATTPTTTTTTTTTRRRH
jgi:hypothetical protein